MTQICLIRHGQTDWNKAGRLQGQTNIPLNDAGRKQARECRDHLSGGDWDVMITTSLNRARETGEIINEKMSLPIEIMDEFMERGFGEGEGLTREERRASYEGFDFPGMESEEDLTNRIMAGLSTILSRYPDKFLMAASLQPS
ncbi:putative phosphatase [Rossellomorea marisflavi]